MELLPSTEEDISGINHLHRLIMVHVLLTSTKDSSMSVFDIYSTTGQELNTLSDITTLWSRTIWAKVQIHGTIDSATRNLM